MTDIKTKLTTMGRNDACGGFPSVNIPVYRASTLVFPTLEEFQSADAGRHKFPGYGIYGNPTTQALSDAICEMEEADGTMLVSSGLTAVAIAFMSVVESGDHVLVCDSVYGPTKDFCEHELEKFNISTNYFDPGIGAEIEEMIQDNTKIIFLESPGSQTFEIQDIAEISRVAKAKNPDIVIIGDNTWGTPLYFKPFDHGMDISIQALTKYVGGHSDLLMGSLSARTKYLPALKRVCKNYGTRVTGDECYLALRGLRTMAVRMEHQQAAGIKIATWLRDHDDVARVIHPALEGDEYHERYKKYFSGGASLFAFELKNPPSDKAIAAMLDNMELFHMGFSWGGFESLVTTYKPRAFRSASGNKWDSDPRFIRLNIGLESVDDLIADIEAGLKRLKL